ncbi:MAG: single-stranded DNA-binding protein [SAR324 cluster bacterium]|nr:single-stranded DNA-binding protein [SAR324 cluster bacterium]
MGSLNKVMLIGNLGKDPEIRYTQAGSAVANFPLATTDRWTDRQGQRQERTEWHDIVAFDRLADLAQSYLKKGKSVYVEGRLQTRSWEDQQGQKRYRTEVVANSMQFLEPRSSGEQRNHSSGISEQSRNENVSTETESSSVAENQNEKEGYIKDDVPF